MTAGEDVGDDEDAGDDGPGTTDGGTTWAPEGSTADEQGHGRLVSLLSSDDVAVAREPTAVGDADGFEFDPDAESGATFPQSVASGGPTPTGVLLWTRIAPDAYDDAHDLALEVARDRAFEEPAYRGVLDDGEAIRGHDYTVTVDLDGALDPGSTYYYRFVYDGTASRVGRCRTLPAPDASPDRLSFAVLTCQNYQNGYFGAYRHVAEEDVDFLVHVGDFVYESGDDSFKGLGSPTLPDRRIDLPSGHEHAHELADYRHLHRTYRSDRFLQRALERHTLIPAWDDHEIANDIYWDAGVGAPRADHPKGDDPEFMARLTADAIHAWWEFMPARIGYDPSADTLHERFQLWRAFRFGDLVDLVLTDERLFRDPPRGSFPTRRAVDPDAEPRGRTMLGAAQREWFLDHVRESDALWTVWTDEVLTVPFRLGAGPLSVYPVQGGWDGYTRERRYLTERLGEFDVSNFVTLTGDMHCYIAGYKQRRYDDSLRSLLFGSSVPESERLGVEFMTPPLTSLNVAEALGVSDGLRGRLTRPLLSALITRMNPHIEFFDSHHWGYSVVEFTREGCTYTGYSVDKSDPSGDGKEVLTRLHVPEGRVVIEDRTP